MNRSTSMLLLLCVPLAAACQPFDSGASSEPAPLDFGSVPDPGDGTIPTQTTTPDILLDNGNTSTDPCDKVRADAKKIRDTHCAGCHEATGKAVGDPLRFIMEDEQLMTAPVSTNTEWAADGLTAYIKPGDPDHSLLYWRAAIKGDMPKPPSDPRNTAFPVTTLSDNSVLREWIEHCMTPTAPAAASATQ